MELVEGIREKIQRRQYEFSEHAVDQTVIRGISVAEIEEALTGTLEMIEDYPEDKYGPSCLVLGFTATGRPLHLQCSYPSRPLLKVITVYEPEPKRWDNWRKRKPKTEENDD